MKLQTRRVWKESENDLITDNVKVGQELQVLHALFKGSRTLEAIRTQARKLGYGAKTVNGTIVMKATVNSNTGKQKQKIVYTTASIETVIARVEESGATRTVLSPTILSDCIDNKSNAILAQIPRIKKYFLNAEESRDNNLSGKIGVSWNKVKRRWIATIQFKGAYQHLGSFQICDDAIAVRIAAERAYDTLIVSGATSIQTNKSKGFSTQIFTADIVVGKLEPLVISVKGHTYES